MFKDYLVEAAPSLLFHHVEARGSYQGRVYAVFTKGTEVGLYFGYFGSCSGCGAWGEGGEPLDVNDVLASSRLYPDSAAALAALAEARQLTGEDRWDHPLGDFADSYDGPDFDAIEAALNKI